MHMYIQDVPYQTVIISDVIYVLHNLGVDLHKQRMNNCVYANHFESAATWMVFYAALL